MLPSNRKVNIYIHIYIYIYNIYIYIYIYIIYITVLGVRTQFVITVGISQVSDDLRTTVLRPFELIMLLDNLMFLLDYEFRKSEFYDLIKLICTS